MRFLITLILLCALVPLPSFGHAWLKLKIATTEYAPYTSTDMQHDGYINHIIADAFLEAGVVVEFVSMSWEEALEAAKSGEYDAVSYGNFVRAREDEFFHSEPITAESLVFYVNKNAGLENWRELSDLSEHKMGVTEGYLYNDELASYIQAGNNIVKHSDDDANLRALIQGDIDVFPIDELTGWYLLERDYTKAERNKVMAIKPYISTVTTHLLIPKGQSDSQLILALFNKGLESLTLEGKLTRFKRLLKEGYYQHPRKKVNFDRR